MLVQEVEQLSLNFTDEILVQELSIDQIEAVSKQAWQEKPRVYSQFEQKFVLEAVAKQAEKLKILESMPVEE